MSEGDNKTKRVLIPLHTTTKTKSDNDVEKLSELKTSRSHQPEVEDASLGGGLRVEVLQ